MGCDNGGLIVEKVKRGIGSRQIWGIDWNSKQLSLAKSRGLKIRKSDLNRKFPLPANFFDVVNANQTIEHLSNTDGFVKEIKRVLKPGGYAVIGTENLSSWHNLIALTLGWQAFSQHVSCEYPVGNPLAFGRRKKIENWHGEHRQVFTLMGLANLFTAHGFKIEKQLGAGYYPFFGFLGKLFTRLDSTHSAFVIIKVRKKRPGG